MFGWQLSATLGMISSSLHCTAGQNMAQSEYPRFSLDLLHLEALCNHLPLPLNFYPTEFSLHVSLTLSPALCFLYSCSLISVYALNQQ